MATRFNLAQRVAVALITAQLLALLVSSPSRAASGDMDNPGFATQPNDLIVMAHAEQANLYWELPDSPDGALITDYSIEMSTDDLNWSLMSDGVSADLEASINALTPNTLYYFRVAAITSAGTGQYGYAEPIRTSLPSTPGVPSLSCSISGLEASLIWSPSQSGGRYETGYSIQRQLGSGAWFDLTSKASNVFSYSETTNSSQSGNISYRITSSNEGGWAGWSNPCTILAPSIPSAPSYMTSPTLSALNMSLSWSAPSDGGIQIDAYEVEKRVGVSGSWSQVYNAGPVSGNTQAYSELKPTSSAGEIHYYRIRAVNAVGNSQWSSTLSVQVTSVPSSPTSIVASANSSDITISWSDPSNIAASGPLTFATQITNNGVTWSDFTPSGYPSAASAVFDSGIGGISYRFRVKSVNAFGESAWSSSSNSIQLTTTTPSTPAPSVIINTPSVTIETPAVTVYAPTVSVGAKLSATSLATGLGVVIPSKAKTTVAIAKSSKKFCKVSGGKVVGIKSGPCVATVTVQAPKPKKGKKPAPVKKSVTVQIS